MKIGVFDSGLGGLLILKAIAKKLPAYDYEYFGDTKHVPFGDRSESEIFQFTKEAVEYLFEHDCLIVILACNTASAETLRTLQDEWLPEHYPDRRILGVIIPMVEEVIADHCQHVLLLGTQRTVGSGKYHLELGKRNEIDTKIEAIATPSLVPLLESGDVAEAVAETAAVIRERQSRGDRVDGVILGCTHYNLMVEPLRAAFPDVEFFGQAEIIPQKLTQYLEAHEALETQLSRGGTRNVHVTEHRPEYDLHMQELLEGRLMEA